MMNRVWSDRLTIAWEYLVVRTLKPELIRLDDSQDCIDLEKDASQCCFVNASASRFRLQNFTGYWLHWKSVFWMAEEWTRLWQLLMKYDSGPFFSNERTGDVHDGFVAAAEEACLHFRLLADYKSRIIQLLIWALPVSSIRFAKIWLFVLHTRYYKGLH